MSEKVMPAQNIEAEYDGPPTHPELAKAIVGDITYVGQLCAAYLVLGDDDMLARVDDSRRVLFRNAILELSLLFIRKTTEFFCPNKSNSDNVHARQYLTSFKPHWVIHKDDYKILHKAVGHVTVRGARRAVQGKANDNWPIREWTLRAIGAWIDFYNDLPKSDVFAGTPPLEEISRQRRSLEELAEICRRSNAAD